ncbi:MAG: GntR family transcriptional regulator [Chloroflexota bacterium]
MARFLLESGPIPLHHQVYLDLRGALERGEWRVGDRMPTERDLTIRYGCSLITIRRALDEMSREGRLERARGRGTFVTTAPIVRDIAARASFADEMRARGLEPYAEVLSAVEEPVAPAVAEELGIAPGAPVWYLERVRGADGVPLLLEQARLSAATFPGLLDEDFSTASLYDVLEHRYGRRVVRTRETITAVAPRRREAQLLALRTTRPALALEGAAYDEGGVAVEHSRTIVSGEHARYFIETSGTRARSVEPMDLRSGRRSARSRTRASGDRARPAG